MRINYQINTILGFYPYLVGGSYIVKPDEANDIDILLHQYIHDRGDVQTSIMEAGFRQLREGDEKYDEIDRQRLIEVYEGKIGEDKYNIIVVGASFWPAYEGAVKFMQANPDLCQTRESRIALHRGKCQEVAAIAGIELPNSAY